MVDSNYKQYEDVAEFLKKGSCNVTNMHNCLGMPQSTISQHLQKLKSMGIIKGERNGLEISYEVVDKRVEKIIEALLDK